MKTIIYIFLSIILFMYSCTKEEDKTTKQSIIKEGGTMRIDPIESKINEFMTDLENPSDGSSMLIDDVIWNIEATLNYKYANIDKLDYVNTSKGYFTLHYSSNDFGLIDFDQIVNLFNTFKNKLSSINAEILSDTKWLQIVDIENIEGDSIRMWYCFGIDKCSLPTTFSFGSTDYWLYGASLGKCGSYSGQGSPSDAANQLDLMVRGYINNTSATPLGMRAVVTNIVSPMPIVAGNLMPGAIDPTNPNDVTPQDNQFDYLLAFGTNQWPNYHICLSPNEMNFYYIGAWTLIYQQNSVYPTRELIYTNINAAHTGPNNPPWDFAHGLTTKYGNIFYTVNLNTSNL